MAGSKQWYDITMDHFQLWAEKTKIPWLVVKPHLLDVMKKARSDWPDLLTELPMLEDHKVALRLHWQKLNSDFTI